MLLMIYEASKYIETRILREKNLFRVQPMAQEGILKRIGHFVKNKV